MLYERRVSLDDEVNIGLQLQFLLIHHDLQLLVLFHYSRVHGSLLLHLVDLELHLLEGTARPAAAVDPLSQVAEGVAFLLQLVHHEVLHFNVLFVTWMHLVSRVLPSPTFHTPYPDSERGRQTYTPLHSLDLLFPTPEDLTTWSGCCPPSSKRTPEHRHKPSRYDYG